MRQLNEREYEAKDLPHFDLKEEMEFMKETEMELANAMDFAMMKAYKVGLEELNPEKARFILCMYTGKEVVSMINVSVKDPMAVHFIRDQLLAVITGMIKGQYHA